MAAWFEGFAARAIQVNDVSIHARTGGSLRTGGVEIGDHRDFYATARAAKNFFLVALQNGEHTAAHGAHAQKAYLDRFQRSRCHFVRVI